MRTAIAAESGRKIPDGKLPVIEKDPEARKVIQDALMKNSFMRGLSRVQFDKVEIISSIFQPIKLPDFAVCDGLIGWNID